MNKIVKYSLLGFLAIFLILGFTLAALTPSYTFSSTMMACACMPSEEPYEMPCNTVTGNNFHFFTIIFNVGEQCSGKEILQCEASEEITYTGSKIRLDLECQYGISFSYYNFIPLSSTYNKSI